jgi:UDP-4-amino-4,6-dideoxy-L-N-acetyl-beta-L-altrosamine transaminase
MQTTRFIPYARQTINSADLQAVAEALQGEMITRGPLVDQFENSVADYCGARHAVAFNSGSSAMMAAYFAAEVSAADRLYTSPNTFIATVGAAFNCQPHCGSPTPVFVDIDRRTGNLSLEQLQLNLEAFEATRGRPIIAPVHFAGVTVDMKRLDQLISQPDAVVIEDAAHAIGSSYSDGQKVGSCAWSQMTVFSFHPAKTITTGEGGLVTTNDDELYRRLRLFRNNGIERDAAYLHEAAQPWFYEVQAITGNFNFTEIQAALGLSQMKRIDALVAKRRELVGYYRRALEGMAHIRLFEEDHDPLTGYHLFVIQIDFDAFKKTRAEVMHKLNEKGIGTQVHYIPLYRHPCLSQGREPISDYFPEMEGYYAQALSLPLFSDLTTEDIDQVCRSLFEVLR